MMTATQVGIGGVRHNISTKLEIMLLTINTLESRRLMRNSRWLCKQALEARVTRGSGGMPPQKILKFLGHGNAISSILKGQKNEKMPSAKLASSGRMPCCFRHVVMLLSCCHAQDSKLLS